MPEPTQPDPVQPLRDALRISPGNLPLRRHLAPQLIGLGRLAEAEAELKAAAKLAPAAAEIKLALARCFDRQGKASQAIVVLEDLAGGDSAPAEGRVLLAKLLLRRGDVQAAVSHYQRALESDPSAEDEELTEALGGRPPGHRLTVATASGQP